MSSTSTSSGVNRSATSRTSRFRFRPVSPMSRSMLRSWSWVNRIDRVFPLRLTIPKEYYSHRKRSTL